MGEGPEIFVDVLYGWPQRKAGRICLLTQSFSQSGSHKYVSCLSFSRSHCVKAETFTRFVRDRRNAGFRAICVCAPSTMARWWEMESYKVEPSFSFLPSLVPLHSLKPCEPVDRSLWRTSFFKMEALLCPTHGQTGGAELFILNL